MHEPNVCTNVVGWATRAVLAQRTTGTRFAGDDSNPGTGTSVPQPIVSMYQYANAVGMVPNGPPQTKRENTSYERHGDLVDDPYLWLERGGDRVDEWVDRQNEYADSYLESVDVREALRPQFESLARTTDYGTITPAPTGYFQEVERPDDDQPVLYFRESLEDDREVLVDPNGFSEDATTAIGWWTGSPAEVRRSCSGHGRGRPPRAAAPRGSDGPAGGRSSV